jgi:hypothetical protein
LELDSVLSQITLFTSDLADANSEAHLSALRERIQSVLQAVPLDAFRRDKKLKAIRDIYRQTQDQRRLISELDEFFIENDLYRDAVEPKSTLEQIRAEDLQLVAFEVFG